MRLARAIFNYERQDGLKAPVVPYAPVRMSSGGSAALLHIHASLTGQQPPLLCAQSGLPASADLAAALEVLARRCEVNTAADQ